MADAGADQYTFHLEATGKSRSALQSGIWHSRGFIKRVIFMPTGYRCKLTCAKQSERSVVDPDLELGGEGGRGGLP